MSVPGAVRTVLVVLSVACAAGYGCSRTGSPGSPSGTMTAEPSPAPEPTPDPDPPPPPPAPAPPPPAEVARYRITFNATWSRDTHPTEIPGNPHFSPLIGGTHSEAVRFWMAGGLATEGIERMAELGLPTTLADEVRAAIAAGAAQRVLQGSDLNSPAIVEFEFRIARAFPLVTLVTMVAPSPDWFVGVSALALFQDDAWVDERVIDLLPWDAGTDSGTTFESPDDDTFPREPIHLIRIPPLAMPGGNVRPLGTFTFRRIG